MSIKTWFATRSTTTVKLFGLACLGLAVLPLVQISSGDAWAQSRRQRERALEREREQENEQRAAERARQRDEAAGARRTTESGTPAPATPVPVDASTPFGSALAACEKTQQEEPQFVLPGLKGEIKLDRCYRGRRHLACRFDTVANEGNALIQEFTRIVEQRYQDVTNIEGICKLDFDALVKDMGGTVEFTKRFVAARSEYDARTACANKVKQSIKDVTLPELVQAPEVLKSMMDTIDADITKVSAVHEQTTSLATKIDASQKSIAVLQKIHRAMCMKAKPDETKDKAAAAQ
jgi:hypothetical protein